MAQPLTSLELSAEEASPTSPAISMVLLDSFFYLLHCSLGKRGLYKLEQDIIRRAQEEMAASPDRFAPEAEYLRE